MWFFAQADGGQAVNDFLNSPLGDVAKKGAGVVAAIVIIYGIFKLVTSAAAGRAGAAVRALLICLVVGGLLLDLTLTGNMLSAGLNVGKGIVDQATKVAGN